MPNWCSNELKVEGSPEHIAEWVEAATGEGGNGGETPLAFYRHAPVPGNGSAAKHTGCWGTKWALDEGDVVITVADDERRHYSFDTAWSPPYHWLRACAELHTELYFELVYGEGGNEFAGIMGCDPEGDGLQQQEFSGDEARAFLRERDQEHLIGFSEEDMED